MRSPKQKGSLQFAESPLHSWDALSFLAFLTTFLNRAATISRTVLGSALAHTIPATKAQTGLRQELVGNFRKFRLRRVDTAKSRFRL